MIVNLAVLSPAEILFTAVFIYRHLEQISGSESFARWLVGSKGAKGARDVMGARHWKGAKGARGT